jgi:N-glycosylase/DNA lyase
MEHPLCFCADFYPVTTYIRKKDEEIMPGVIWGDYCQLYTPAFWKFLYDNRGDNQRPFSHKLGNSIIEEIVACLLGGYGMPSELGLLAFKRLRDEHLINPGIDFAQIQEALAIPLQMSNGIFKRYRFYNQKSKFIHNFLKRDDLAYIPVDNDLKLRSWLLTVEGIGLKTASWITRNWLQSQNVAILDIHILRAGRIAGFFRHMDVGKHYFALEKDFIDFCAALDALPSDMDALIWSYMKKTNTMAMQLL